MPENAQDLAQTPLIYWTTEQKGKWQIIRDTPEAREDAIRKGAMFFSSMSLEKPWENSGAPEPNRQGDFILDFDGPNAVQEARDLAMVHLPDLYGADPYGLRFFMSGQKGIHIEAPQEYFGDTAGDPLLPKIHKRIAAELKTAFDLTTLDMLVYNMKRGRMWRIKNVKRANGRYKVPLTLEEFRDLPEADLIELTKAPREIDVIDDDPPDVCPDLKDLFDEAKAFVYQEQAEKVESDPLTDEEKARISKEIPPCVRYVLTACPTTEKTNFNKLVLNLCKYFITAGHDLKSSIEAVWPFLEKYPHSGTYTTKEQRLQHWKELYTYLSGDADSVFNCSYMRGMSFPGSAFECKTCLKRITPEDFDNLDTPTEPFSAAALKLAKEIENAIAEALKMPLDDSEGIASLGVNTAVIDRMINGAFWSGQKSKLFLLNHNDSLNQYQGKDAYLFLAKTFGRVVDAAKVRELAEAVEGLNAADKKKFVSYVCSIHQTAIMNYLKHHNQRDAVEWRVNMFSKRNRMELKEDVARLILPHKPFVAQGKRDDAVVQDFKEHFTRFDVFLTFFVMARFVLDRKKAYLWLKADSDWGKGFLLGILKDMACSVQTSMKEVEKMLEGAPSGRSPKDFKRAFVFVIDEFKTVKSELKQLQSEISLCPKNQLACSVEVFAKLFLSAESVASLVGETGVEDQFANRMSIFEETGSIVTRPMYKAKGTSAYFNAIKAYTIETINAQVAEMQKLGKDSAELRAERWLDDFIKNYGLDTKYQRLSASLPDLAKEIEEYWREWWEKKYLKTTNLGTFVKTPNKALEIYLEEHFDKSQIHSLRKKKEELLKLISHDGKGVRSHRVDDYDFIKGIRLKDLF